MRFRRTMSSRNGRSARTIVAAAVAVTVITGAAAPGRGNDPIDPVTAWATEHAASLSTVDPTDPLDDLAPLRAAIGEAEIVGLGESVHGAAEEITLKHRVLRLLVERSGFRSIAWEDDWTTGALINDYITGGDRHLDALMLTFRTSG